MLFSAQWLWQHQWHEQKVKEWWKIKSFLLLPLCLFYNDQNMRRGSFVAAFLMYCQMTKASLFSASFSLLLNIVWMTEIAYKMLFKVNLSSFSIRFPQYMYTRRHIAFVDWSTNNIFLIHTAFRFAPFCMLGLLSFLWWWKEVEKMLKSRA